MALDDVISVTITANSRTPSRQGFGNQLCLAYHAQNVDLYRVYEDEAEVLADGHTALSRAYKMVAAAFSQNPRPPKVLLGRLPTASTQTFALTVTSNTEGAVVSLEVLDTAGVWQPITYTVPAAQTLTQVATAVELLVEAITGVTSSSAVDVITVTPTVNTAPIGLRNPQNCTIKDNSTDSGYATALGNIFALTKDFYFVTTDHNSEVIGDAVAAWAQTNKRLYVTQTNDSIEASGTGVFGSGQKALSYTYSAGLFVHDVTEYGACAMAAIGSVRDPGSFTWSLKPLLGITPAVLTSTQETNLKTAGWNFYVEVANDINGIWGDKGGGAAFGGRFLDLTHGTDALTARLQEGILGVLANADKIDYTEAGIQPLVSKTKAVLRQFEGSRLLVTGSSSVTYTDPLDETLEDDREDRYYPALKFASVYAGAVHRARIIGTIA